MNKKGQSALEFIMTYGWALVVLLLVIGSLWFTFGGDKYFVTEKCMMGPGFLCKDFRVDEGSIQLKVKNSYGKDLDSISFTYPDCTISSDSPNLKNGDEDLFTVGGCIFDGLGVFDDRLDFAYSFVDSTIMHSKSALLVSLIGNGCSNCFGGGGSGNGGGGSGNGYGSDGATALLYKFDEGDGGSIGDESGNGYDGILISQGELVDNGGAETGDTTNFINVDGVTNSDSNSGIYSFYEEGGKSLKSDEFIPIDLDTAYNLKGRFKSYGSPSDSKLYFGYTPYDGNQQIIKRDEIQPFVGTETTLYADVNAQDMIIKVIDASMWDTSTYHAVVAFNIDDSGNYNDLPNRELSNRMGIKNCNPTKSDMGDHWEVSFCGGQTVGEDYFAGTKVRQHMSGGTYMYDGASNVNVASTWTEYSGSTQGENVYGGAIGKWWRGTRYAKILFLLNYKTASSNIENKTRFDDISLTAVPIQYSNKWNSGYYGSAVNFNGVDDYVDTGVSDLGISIAGAITAEAWIYPRSVNGFYKNVVGNWKWDTGGWLLRLNSNGNLIFTMASGSTYNTAVCSTVPLDTWTHIAGVWDGNEVRCYVGGVLGGSISMTSFVESTDNVNVGFNSINAGQGNVYFDGLIDEVRISDYVRYT